jgi:PEP-CTERM motif-containing protein
MKRRLLWLVLVVLVLSFAGQLRADTVTDQDPAVLFIGSTGCAAPPGCPVFGNEVNALHSNTLTITENGSGQPMLGNPVLLILGFANVSSTFVPPSITLSSGTGSAGGPNVYPNNTTKWDSNGFAGFYTAAFTPPKGSPNSVYSFIGLVTAAGGSESFTNWSAADLAVNGITANGFGIVVYELFNTGLTGGGSVTINFSSNLPLGTFAVAYGCSGATGANGSCPGKNTFSTPFTQSGVVNTVVPEPASLLLLGSGLVAAGALRKKQKKQAEA